MKRDYTTGQLNNVDFFTGVEVEHTPAFGLATLFVVGTQDIELVESHLQNTQCKHIFFGANHSFHPETVEDWRKWEKLICHFLEKGLLCSLDIPITCVEEFNESEFCDHDNFIPQIRVPIPYTKLWNYNTMIKIDDLDFNYSNPGVWTHSLHDLMDRKKFTSWDKYKNDEVIK